MSSGAKTVALWLVLILIFFALFQFFSGAPAAAPHRDSSSASSPWVWVFAMLVVGGAIGFGRFQRSRPWRKQYDAAMLAFGKGRFAEALELWTQSFEKTPWKPTVRFNIASARINLWQLRRAREDLLQSLELAAKAKQAALPPVAHVQLAFLDALEGNAASAREYAAKGKSAPTDHLPLLTEAVLDLREGRVEKAQRALRQSETRQIQGTLGELVRSLDAFCVFLASGEARHVDKVALFHEASPDELLAAWPEFAAFLARAPQS